MVISVTLKKMIWVLISIIISRRVILFRQKKQKVVKELKALAKKSDEVWLASDEDREGEASAGIWRSAWP